MKRCIGELEQKGNLRVEQIRSIEMVWACGKNGCASYCQKGVDVRSKYRGRVRGRPRLCWMDGVKVALGNRGMTVEAARQCAKDRKEWRALVHM